VKVQWCWRCAIDLPMLDENEFAAVQEAFHAAFSPADRSTGTSASESAGVDARFAPVLALYQKLTGFTETNSNAVMHHRLSLYGGPCAVCSKPLRSPSAKICVACGAPVELSAPAL
jgi:hypothetical protein